MVGISLFFWMLVRSNVHAEYTILPSQLLIPVAESQNESPIEHTVFQGRREAIISPLHRRGSTHSPTIPRLGSNSITNKGDAGPAHSDIYDTQWGPLGMAAGALGLHVLHELVGVGQCLWCIPDVLFHHSDPGHVKQ